MPLSTALQNYLKRGGLPLTSSDGVGLWAELISAIELNPVQTITDITAAMLAFRGLAFDDCFSAELEVNHVVINTGQNQLNALLGAMHARLCSNYSVAYREPVQSLIQRVRALMETRGGLSESSVNLGLDHNHLMGNGLVADPLTCLPDRAWGVVFGSVPDQSAIGIAAPAWLVLKRRAFEQLGVLTRYGAKPHYVLAHLLNHNLNGPGDEQQNVVPFWATANTAMAKQAESHVKELVQRGAEVRYIVRVGPPVGMTPGRQAALAACTEQAQRDLIELEQHLPMNLVIECDALDTASHTWINVVNCTIDNYVPETVPYLLS